MDDSPSFGEWLRRRRKALDLTQDALAQLVGCSTASIRKFEGDEQRPSRPMAERLATQLQLAGADHPAFVRYARGHLDAPPPALPPAASASIPTNPPRAATVIRTNLPAQYTPFLGRAQELATLETLLTQPNIRVITITGHGGMGKTRLALALGQRRLEHGAFADGVFLVALAPLSAAVHLEIALADALSFPLSAGGPQPRTPRQQLCDYLQTKRMLLLLDNCEHLRAGVCDLTIALLAAAPGLQIVATSREQLDLPGEQRFPLGGLSAAAADDGVALFTAAATRLQPTFALDHQSRAAAARICHLVGGMPLAIELAAGWVDTLPLDAIATAIAQDLGLLEADSVAIPARQRSIRTVFDSAWDRLDPTERAVFAQLAVFRGGCTARAVQAITGASLPQLRRFVGRSLLQLDPTRDHYSIHELLRQYAAEQLAGDAAIERALRDRHAAYYLEALATREGELKSERQLEALGEIARDSENIRAAWNWAAQAGTLGLLSQAVGSLSLAYEWLGRSQDGLEATRAAAAAVAAAGYGSALQTPQGAGDERAELQALLLAAQARFAFLLGDLSGAAELLQQAQALLDIHGSERASTTGARAQVLLQIGRCAMSQDLVTARAALAQCLALFEAVGDRWSMATAMAGLGLIAISLPSGYGEAQRSLEQSVALYRAIGDRIGLSEALHLLSMSLRFQNHVPESELLAREAYALAQKTGNRRSIAQAGNNLGAALYWANKHEESYAVLSIARAITEDLGHRAELPDILFALGYATMCLGRYAEARATLTAGLAIARAVDSVADTSLLLFGLGYVALAEGANTEARSLAEEAIALNQGIGQQVQLVLSLNIRALADRRLASQDRARATVVTALHTALSIYFSFHTTLLPIILLLVDDGMPDRAAAAFALLGKLPSLDNAWGHDVALREIQALLTALPAQTIAAAQAHWTDYDVWEAGQELLSELEAAGWGMEA